MATLAQLATHKTSYSQRNKYLGWGTTVVTMLAIVWITNSQGLYEAATIEQWMSHDNHLLLIISVSFVLMFLCAVTPLPAEALTLANGVIFGPVVGTFITWSSAMLGAYITFLWSRRLINNMNTNFLNQEKYQKVNHWIQKWGILGFLLARLVPVVPFFALNIAAAMLPVSSRNYLLITGIAILPHIFIICVFGGHVAHH